MPASQNPKLQEKIAHMALPLAPFVHLTTGHIHPAFPGTMLQYWLLTDSKLEELAHFYHQRTPCMFTQCYPKPVVWNRDMTLEEKRRKWGKFMGLRGCDTPPVIKTEDEIWEEARRARLMDEDEIWEEERRARLMDEDEIWEEARRARLMDEDDMWRKKFGWY